MIENPTYDELKRRVQGLETELDRVERFQKISYALFEISNALNAPGDLSDFYASIHQALGTIVDATNFYIALYDRSRDRITFPYCIDSVDECYPPVIDVSQTDSLTAAVIRSGRPLLATKEDVVRQREKTRLKVPACTPSEIWLGVPLKTGSGIIGVMAVQSYTDPHRYDQTDIDVMTSVADQAAVAIQHKRAEARLRESEEQFRLAFQTSPDSIDLNRLDDGVYIDINEGFTRIMGYGRDEVVGQSSLSLNIWNDPGDRQRLVKGLKKSGHVDNLEARFVGKDGLVRRGLMSARIIRINGENVVISITRDITDRKKAEDAFRRESERNHAILRALPDMVFLFSWDGTIIDVHANDTTDLFLPPEMFVGKSIDEVMPPEIAALTRKKLGMVAGGQGMQKYEYTLIIRDISQRFEARMVPAGENEVLVIVRNITQQKKAEEDRDRLISAMEQAGEVFVITDKRGDIQYVNPAFERITGYARDEVIGENPRILKSGVHDNDFYRAMWQTLNRGDIWRGRMVNKQKNGNLYTEDVTISPVCDTAGCISNFVAVKRDITDEIKLETQLRQVQKVESIGRLAGGVAHDLNNLLSPILGYGEMLMEDLGTNDARRGHAGEVLKAGHRARDLVKQLLAFSRKQTLEYRPMDLNSTLTEFEKLLHRTIPEDVQIRLALASDVGTVMADIGQIEQVIMNLAVNAADAMPNGGRLIFETGMVVLDEAYAASRPGVKPGAYVLLAISDTGCGMDEEVRENIFEPFFSTKGEQGTGLGLATVYGIVKQHDGNIWVYSEPGQGTTFKIYLPVSHEPNMEDEPDDPGEPEEIKGSETVLLVEDNEQVRLLAHAILRRQGYRVLVEEDGAGALATLAAHGEPVHLLLTDVVMPGMNGRDLYDKVMETHPGVSVLFMSGYSTDIIAHRGVLDQGVQFIQKPFTIQGLAAKVRAVLDEGKNPASGAGDP